MKAAPYSLLVHEVTLPERRPRSRDSAIVDLVKSLPSFDPAMPRLLDIYEASEVTGVPANVLRAEIAAGRLGACRIRNRWRLTGDHIRAWIQRIETRALDT